MTLPTSCLHRSGIPAAAWFSAQSFHGSSAHARPLPKTTAKPLYTDCKNCGSCDHAGYACPCGCHDTRPRQDYLLPSGELVTLILDHGEVPEPSRTFASGGRVVTALIAPIRRTEIVALLTYAMLHNDQRLRYLAADAIGVARGSVPMTGAERCAAVQACAGDLQMLRAMGVEIGGGL